MVKYETILKAIDEYFVKCPTISEKKIMLRNMSLDEKNERLEQVLNQGEKEWYKYLIANRDYYGRRVQEELEDEEGVNEEYYNKLTKEVIPQLDDDIFKLERKILEKQKERLEPPVVDESEYIMESPIDTEKEHYGNVLIGDVEQRQIYEQEATLKFKDIDEFLNVKDYFSNGYQNINSKLNNGKTWTGYSEEEREALSRQVNKEIRALTSAINRSTGLVDNTILFHSGYFDVTKRRGDKVKFKGFTSASFQKQVADDFKMSYHSFPKQLNYTYKILAPKGTKGLCGNASGSGILNLSGHGREHEFLLDKGLEAQITDIDYENKVVTVLVQ